MAKRSRVTLSLDERLRDSARQTTSMALPLAIHHRLDVLADLAADVNASRAEIIAMLIAEAELDAAALERSILAYRKRTVGEVVPEGSQQAGDQAAADLISLPVRQAGRPPARTARTPRSRG